MQLMYVMRIILNHIFIIIIFVLIFELYWNFKVSQASYFKPMVHFG